MVRLQGLRERKGCVMPGPVSDSFDPEFGTCDNAARVREAITQQVARLTDHLGHELKDIVGVVDGPAGPRLPARRLSEREARVIRFALNRALETI